MLANIKVYMYFQLLGFNATDSYEIRNVHTLPNKIGMVIFILKCSFTSHIMANTSILQSEVQPIYHNRPLDCTKLAVVARWLLWRGSMYDAQRMKKVLMRFADIAGPDQPAQMRRLIRAFVARL